MTDEPTAWEGEYAMGTCPHCAGTGEPRPHRIVYVPRDVYAAWQTYMPEIMWTKRKSGKIYAI